MGPLLYAVIAGRATCSADVPLWLLVILEEKMNADEKRATESNNGD